MEKPRPLTERFSVMSQITPADIPELAAQGFRTLIDNRPNSEIDPAQGSEAMRKAAQDAGMEFLYIPFVPGQVTEEMVQEFAQALDRSEPVLAYCRSGTRSTTLWALASAGHMPAETIIANAATAGYDLAYLAPALKRPQV